jgi:hypothetical protein
VFGNPCPKRAGTAQSLLIHRPSLVGAALDIRSILGVFAFALWDTTAVTYFSAKTLSRRIPYPTSGSMCGPHQCASCAPCITRSRSASSGETTDDRLGTQQQPSRPDVALTTGLAKSRVGRIIRDNYLASGSRKVAAFAWEEAGLHPSLEAPY